MGGLSRPAPVARCGDGAVGQYRSYEFGESPARRTRSVPSNPRHSAPREGFRDYTTYARPACLTSRAPSHSCHGHDGSGSDASLPPPPAQPRRPLAFRNVNTRLAAIKSAVRSSSEGASCGASCACPQSTRSRRPAAPEPLQGPHPHSASHPTQQQIRWRRASGDEAVSLPTSHYRQAALVASEGRSSEGACAPSGSGTQSAHSLPTLSRRSSAAGSQGSLSPEDFLQLHSRNNAWRARLQLRAASGAPARRVVAALPSQRDPSSPIHATPQQVGARAQSMHTLTLSASTPTDTVPQLAFRTEPAAKVVAPPLLPQPTGAQQKASVAAPPASPTAPLCRASSRSAHSSDGSDGSGPSVSHAVGGSDCRAALTAGLPRDGAAPCASQDAPTTGPTADPPLCPATILPATSGIHAFGNSSTPPQTCDRPLSECPSDCPLDSVEAALRLPCTAADVEGDWSGVVVTEKADGTVRWSGVTKAGGSDMFYVGLQVIQVNGVQHRERISLGVAPTEGGELHVRVCCGEHMYAVLKGCAMGSTLKGALHHPGLRLHGVMVMELDHGMAHREEAPAAHWSSAAQTEREPAVAPLAVLLSVVVVVVVCASGSVPQVERGRGFNAAGALNTGTPLRPNGVDTAPYVADVYLYILACVGVVVTAQRVTVAGVWYAVGTVLSAARLALGQAFRHAAALLLHEQLARPDTASKDT